MSTFYAAVIYPTWLWRERDRRDVAPVLPTGGRFSVRLSEAPANTRSGLLCEKVTWLR